MFRLQWLTLLISFLYVTYSYSLPIGAFSSGPSIINVRPSMPTECGFAGNSDLYGIGIRIGYYTQALSVWFANYFVLGESKVLRSVNLLFMFALFIGLTWLSHQPSQIYAVEAYLLNHLLIVTWSVGVFDKARFSRKYWRFSPVRVVVQRLTLMGIVGYDVWFWWRGLDLMKQTLCGTFIFLVVKVDLYGWFRTLAKICCIIGVFGHMAKNIAAACRLFQHKYNESISNADYYRRLYTNLVDTLSKETPGQKVNRNIVLAPQDIIEVAIHTPLPQSPQSQGTFDNSQAHPPIQPSPPLPTQQLKIEVPVYTDLLSAEAYLGNVLSITTSNLQPRIIHIPWTAITITIPSTSPQWLQLKQIRQRLPRQSLRSIRPFRMSIIVTLVQHIYEHRSYPFYIYPKMLETALTDPHHKILSYSALKTIMAIRTVRTPSYVPPAAYMLPAVNRFLTIVFLILSVELCLRWNSVSGVGNFGAVGQLIPCVIGLGGLARVLWIFWRHGGGLSEHEEDGIGIELRECAEVYEKLKERDKMARNTVVTSAPTVGV